jgi:hypothetical protein
MKLSFLLPYNYCKSNRKVRIQSYEISLLNWKEERINSMSEIINGKTYESLWHSSVKYKSMNNAQKEQVALAMEKAYRNLFAESPPYVNKEEGQKHGFPQGYLGYPQDFLGSYLDPIIVKVAY